MLCWHNCSSKYEDIEVRVSFHNAEITPSPHLFSKRRPIYDTQHLPPLVGRVFDDEVPQEVFASGRLERRRAGLGLARASAMLLGWFWLAPPSKLNLIASAVSTANGVTEGRNTRDQLPEHRTMNSMICPTIGTMRLLTSHHVPLRASQRRIRGSEPPL